MSLKSKQTESAELSISKQQESSIIQGEQEQKDDNQLIQIKREFRIDGQRYVYDGPDHPYVQDLFQMLDDKERKPSTIEIYETFYQKFTELEEWFQRKCEFGNGFISITPYFVMNFMFYLSIYFVYLIHAMDLLNNQTVLSNPTLLELVGYLPECGLIFLIINLFFLMLNSYFIIVLFAIGGLFIPLCFILFQYLNVAYFYSQADYNIKTLTMLFTISCSSLNSIIINLTGEWIAQSMNKLIKMFFQMGWCLLIVYLICSQILLYVLSTQIIDYTTILKYAVESVYIPMFFILIFSWFMIKVRLFDWQSGLIKSALDRIKERLTKRYLQAQQVDQDRNWIVRKADQLIAYCIGIMYIMSEIWLFVLLAQELQNSPVSYEKIITFSFELIIIPFHLIFGVFVSVSDRKRSFTYLIVPLCIGAPPIFLFIKLGNIFISSTQWSSIQGVIQYVPLLLQLFWLALVLIGLERRRLYMYLFGFMCYFIAFPIGVLLPLYNLTGNSGLLISTYVILVVGIGLLVILFMRYVLQQMRETWKLKDMLESDYPEFSQLETYNLTDYAYFINAVFFLIGFFLISYFFWDIQDNKSNSASSAEKGTLYALIVILPTILILVNKALKWPALYLSNEFEEGIGHQFERERNLKTQALLKRQNYIVTIGVALPAGLFIPLGLLISNEIASTLFLGIGIGIPIAFAIFKLLLLVKNASVEYQNFFSPMISAILWCCVIFPFGVILPIIAVYLSNTTNEFIAFAQAAVAFGLFICVVGVTTTSLFFSILLNREEFERKKRDVLKYVIEAFAENQVLSDLSVTSILYIKFYTLAQKTYKELFRIANLTQRKQKQKELKLKLKTHMTDLLLKGDPVNVIKYEGVEMQYDHQLVSKSIYEDYQAYLLKSQIKEEKKKRHWLIQLLIDCIQCRCGLEELEELDKQKEVEMLQLRDLLRADEEAQKNIETYIPAFSNIYKLAYEEENQNLLQKYEIEPQNQMYLKKNQYQAIEELQSSKTDQLKQIQKKQVDQKAFQKVKSTEYYHSLKQNNELVAQFMHEVFMEFANQEQNCEPSICYNDLQEFCRLTDLHFSLQDYKRHAKMPWINQSHSLSETDFACLIKSLFSEYEGDSFNNLKQLVLDQIYPNLIINVKTLMYNVKELNRIMLNKTNQPNNQLPFQISNFNDNSIVAGGMDAAQALKRNLKMKEKAKEKSASQSEIKMVQQKKSAKQRELEYAQKQQEIESKYEEILPGYKKCCYGCSSVFRAIFWLYPSECWDKLFGGMGGLKREFNLKRPIVLAFSSKRARMPDWQRVAPQIITTMMDAADKYDKERKNRQKKDIKFTNSSSNYLALIFKVMDYYALAVVAFASQVGWFGESTFNPAETISGEAFYDSYVFYFYLCFSLSMVYGVLGRMSIKKVQDNSFGQNESGDIAKFPHPQFFLPRFISILSGFFIVIMRTYIDGFACNYNVTPYVLIRDSSIECLSKQHYIYMGLSLLGVLVYYPLSTYLQPTFQYSDHSLDLKYKSTYLILFVQGKLIILAMASLFQTFENAILYQMIIGSIVIILLLLIHIRNQPCLVQKFNFYEQLMLVIVLNIYIGAIIIIITKNNILGIVITGVGVLVISSLMVFYLYKQVQQTSKTKIHNFQQIDNSNIQISKKTNYQNIQQLIEQDRQKQKNEMLKIQKQEERFQIQIGDEQMVQFNQSLELSANEEFPEMKNIRDEINSEKVSVDYEKAKKLKQI